MKFLIIIFILAYVVFKCAGLDAILAENAAAVAADCVEVAGVQGCAAVRAECKIVLTLQQLVFDAAGRFNGKCFHSKKLAS